MENFGIGFDAVGGRRDFIRGVSALSLLSACGCRTWRASAYPETRAELERQIAAGLIDCAAFTIGADGPIETVGWKRIAPERVPLCRDAVFDVASLTKVVVASELAILYADGKFDPDAPFTEYLPDHALGKSNRITCRDLATHVSGFKYKVFDGASFDRDVLAYLPSWPRGTKGVYNCYNFILLGMVVERISGMRLDEFAKARLFAPLGMRDSAWGPFPDDGRFVWFPCGSVGRTRRPGDITDSNAHAAPHPIGNAGVFSTARDMARFADDLANARTFPRAYYDLLRTATCDVGGFRRTFGWDARREKIPDGLSPRAIVHSGWTGQTLAVDPETGFSATLLTARRGNHSLAFEARRKALGILAREAVRT